MNYRLKREHAKRILEALRPSLQYLSRLESRLIAVGAFADPDFPMPQQSTSSSIHR